MTPSCSSMSDRLVSKVSLAVSSREVIGAARSVRFMTSTVGDPR